MKRGNVEIICGEEPGKAAMALGRGMSALMEHKRVIMIQFLKGCAQKEGQEILERLEPDFKVFRFEKSNTSFEELSEEEKQEELVNIRNGFNFARKVAATGECDMLILDEVLEMINRNIITLEDVQRLLESKEEELDLVLTGRIFPEKLNAYVDVISTIDYIEVDKNKEEC